MLNPEGYTLLHVLFRYCYIRSQTVVTHGSQVNNKQTV